MSLIKNGSNLVESLLNTIWSYAETPGIFDFKKDKLTGLNTWCHSNSVSFKSHSISVTFKFCAVRVALCALEPRSTDSLGTQHCANFESHSNRVTFETNAISVISSVHPQWCHFFFRTDFIHGIIMFFLCKYLHQITKNGTFLCFAIN